MYITRSIWLLLLPNPYDYYSLSSYLVSVVVIATSSVWLFQLPGQCSCYIYRVNVVVILTVPNNTSNIILTALLTFTSRLQCPATFDRFEDLVNSSLLSHRVQIL